jgi:glycopeptide antibiotics resistance protein
MKKLLRPLFYVTFGIYCIVLLSLLLLNRSSLYTKDFTEYARNCVNLIPFQTLFELFRRNAEQSINTDIVFDNAVGNFLLFLPMGFCLPCMSQNAKKLPRLLLSIFLLVLLIETLQLVFRVGSFDVDDILLNVAGSAVGYSIWRIEVVQRMLRSMQWMR